MCFCFLLHGNTMKDSYTNQDVILTQIQTS